MHGEISVEGPRLTEANFVPEQAVSLELKMSQTMSALQEKLEMLQVHCPQSRESSKSV